MRESCISCGGEYKFTKEFKINICLTPGCESRRIIFDAMYQSIQGFKTYSNLDEMWYETSRGKDMDEEINAVVYEFQNFGVRLPDSEIVEGSERFFDSVDYIEDYFIFVLLNSDKKIKKILNGKEIWNANILNFINLVTQNNESEKEMLELKFNSISTIQETNKRARDNRNKRAEDDRAAAALKAAIDAAKRIEEERLSLEEERINYEKESIEAFAGKYLDSIFIFDLDNTLRYEIDDTPIEHGINLFNKVLNKENTAVYIASCNRKQSVVTWVENNNYTDKVSIHAPICGSGFKDLTSVVDTFNHLNIDENANKFVIGDTFKDMDSIRIIREKITGKRTQNWYFIRSYFRSYKLVEQHLKNNPDLFLLPDGTRHIYPQTDYVYPFDAEEKFYNYNCGDLYFLPDGVLLPNLSEVGFLSTDYHNFKNIDFFQNSKELYIIAKYGDHYQQPGDIDTIENKFKNSFKVAILGRYFRASLHIRSNPARVSAAEILDFKKGNPLSNNLKLSLDNFFNEQIKNFPNIEGGNIIISSVPNSDGKYRFNNYLLELKNKIKDMDIELDIFILDDFIRQVGEKGQNHNLQGVDNRMNNVKGKYAINEKYLSNQEFMGAHVFVIDDVLTSGSTFNEINETLNPYGFNFLGVVLGKHQSYPYTDSMGLVSYNYLPINESAFAKYISDPWYDDDNMVGPEGF